MKHDDYKKTLFQKNIIKQMIQKMKTMNCKSHQSCIYDINKTLFACFDNKRYILGD